MSAEVWDRIPRDGIGVTLSIVDVFACALTGAAGWSRGDAVSA